MARVAPIGVRFEQHVRTALEKMAKQEGRSVSNLIDRIVTDYLRAKKAIK